MHELGTFHPPRMKVDAKYISGCLEIKVKFFKILDIS